MDVYELFHSFDSRRVSWRSRRRFLLRANSPNGGVSLSVDGTRRIDFRTGKTRLDLHPTVKSDDYIRVSVGLEDVRNIIADFDQALGRS